MRSPLRKSVPSSAKQGRGSAGPTAGSTLPRVSGDTSFSSSRGRASKSPRAEHRHRARQRIENSAKLAEKYPHLTSFTASLEFGDAFSNVKRARIKYRANLEHAKSVLVFACPNPECIGGDFDLTGHLSDAIASGLKTVTRQVRCHGRCRTPAKGILPCRSTLHYTLNFEYAVPAVKKRQYVPVQ